MKNFLFQKNSSFSFSYFCKFLILIILLVTCAKEDPNIYSETIGYKLIHFADYEQKGVYVLDTRHFLKTTIYYFDFASEQWSAFADNSGLTAASRYSTAKISSVFSYSKDSLMVISFRGNIFCYNTADQTWSNSQNNFSLYDVGSVFNNYYGYSRITSGFELFKYYFNPFDGQIYKTNLASFTYAYNDSIYFYKLINQSEWRKIAVFVDDSIGNKYYLATIPVDKGKFENIFRYHSFDYTYEDPIEQSNYSLTYDLIDSISQNTGEKDLGGYYVDKVFYINGSLFSTFHFNSYSGNDDTGDFYTLFKIIDNTPVQVGEVIDVVSESAERIDNWNEIEYDLQSTNNLYLYNDSFYFFIDDMVYKLSPGSSSWTKLSSIPFKTLNRKTE